MILAIILFNVGNNVRNVLNLADSDQLLCIEIIRENQSELQSRPNSLPHSNDFYFLYYIFSLWEGKDIIPGRTATSFRTVATFRMVSSSQDDNPC